MSSTQTVLYDIPGPKARARNWLYSVLFVLVLALVIYFVYTGFDEKGQWAGALWKPFIEGSTWTQFLLPGLLNTLKAAGLSIVIALPIGALLGIGRLSDHKWIRLPVGWIVEFFRAIPVLLLMVFAAAFYAYYTGIDSEIRPLFAAVTGLVLYNGSVLAEVFRAGILSLPKGQAEASSALGLRKTQTMVNVLLPQAVTLMLPALVSQLVVILKDTALAGQLTIGFDELIRGSGPLTGLYGNTIPTLIVVAIIFIVLNLLLTQFASWLENKLARRKKAPKGAKPVMAATSNVVLTRDDASGGAL
ncbi:amino acid ABC transporter permease [Amycolatopsis decaplanina]|uniref:Glutamate permease n=1 Tax=Amycolatopsis decaplanina DSM 44594 TaxID=1284240 RepID=M2ZQ30_9PSEU|nr:amino acid ABC transporter permease [Amycolatopsis decaplanina]EME62913.1 glutamate permease [Amycolatopsis decaplanina DSM 44594]